MTARVTHSTMANGSIHHVAHVAEGPRTYRVCRVVHMHDDRGTFDFNAEAGKAELWLKGTGMR